MKYCKEILHELKSSLVLARVMVIRGEEVNREHVLRVIRRLLRHTLVLRSRHQVHLLLSSLILSYLYHHHSILLLVPLIYILKIICLLHINIFAKREERER